MPSTFPNPVELEAAVRARLIASMNHADIDVTVQGVAAHMTGSSFRAESGANPYIVFDLLNGAFTGSFAADGALARYRVTIHDHPDNMGNGNAAAAFDGLWGDFHPTDTPAPNYGMHMWIPAIAGMDESSFVAKSWSTPHTPDVLNYQIVFEALIHNEE